MARAHAPPLKSCMHHTAAQHMLRSKHERHNRHILQALAQTRELQTLQTPPAISLQILSPRCEKLAHLHKMASKLSVATPQCMLTQLSCSILAHICSFLEYKGPNLKGSRSCFAVLCKATRSATRLGSSWNGVIEVHSRWHQNKLVDHNWTQWLAVEGLRPRTVLIWHTMVQHHSASLRPCKGGPGL